MRVTCKGKKKSAAFKRYQVDISLSHPHLVATVQSVLVP